MFSKRLEFSDYAGGGLASDRLYRERVWQTPGCSGSLLKREGLLYCGLAFYNEEVNKFIQVTCRFWWSLLKALEYINSKKSDVELTASILRSLT
jgi:hypothetical protein